MFFILMMILSVGIGRHYYFVNEKLICSQAESILIDLLKLELEKRREVLKIPYHSFSGGVDTIPLFIRVTTKDGTYQCKIDPDKSKKNISSSHFERSLQSICLLKSPLDPCSLEQIWVETLKKNRINATTAIKISVEDIKGDIITVDNEKRKDCSSFMHVFVFYIGNRCEVTVKGYVKYAWLSVCSYNWMPFFINIAVLLLFCGILFYFLIFKKGYKDVMIENSVICEDNGIVEIAEKIKPKVYQLSIDLIFNPREQILKYKNEDINLSPQSVAILKLFLDAPDNTVQDDDIVKNVWGMTPGTSIKNFRSASQRIYKVFDKIDFSIKFVRIGIDKYTLIFLDNQ